MPVTYNPVAETASYDSITDAPAPLNTFFDQLAGHFRRRAMQDLG